MTQSPDHHEHRLRVRYGETDQMGVAHHANYLLYMEDARTRMMAEMGCSYAEMEREGWGLPVRRTEIRYRSPLLYDEEFCVRTRVARVGGASVTFEYELVKTDGSLVATGMTELACVRLDSEARKPQMMPDTIRELLGGGRRKA